MISWAVAARPLAGEVVSGDRPVLLQREAGALAGAIDGAGHGPEAAAAAERAQAVLAEAVGQPLPRLFELCHGALRSTRGAAMSLAWLDFAASTLSWAGVGNVEGALVRPDGRPREVLLLRGGVVGYQMRPPRVSTLPFSSGDLLVFATDGIRPDFLSAVSPAAQPRGVADGILARHGKTTDDALALVVRRA